MWPSSARRNRRNRRLPSNAIPPTAEQAQLQPGDSSWSNDGTFTFVEMSIVYADENPAPILNEGYLNPLPPYAIPGCVMVQAQVTNAGNTLSMKWQGVPPNGTAFNWPASQVSRTHSGGIIQPVTGTITFEE